MTASSRRVPVSRRDRPAKAPLSREAIVGAALDVIRDDGLGRLTMRRLAAGLDTGPASLYVYFENTDELYAAVLDELLGTVALARRGGPWRERIVALLTSYTEVLYTHPALARTALVSLPSGANSLNIWEALLALLDEGGIGRANAAWAVDLLLQRATAIAAEHGTRDRTAGGDDEFVRAGEVIAAASPTTHPHVAAASHALTSGTPDTRLAWGFEVLLNGVTATAHPDEATHPESKG